MTPKTSKHHPDLATLASTLERIAEGGRGPFAAKYLRNHTADCMYGTDGVNRGDGVEQSTVERVINLLPTEMDSLSRIEILWRLGDRDKARKLAKDHDDPTDFGKVGLDELALDECTARNWHESAGYYACKLGRTQEGARHYSEAWRENHSDGCGNDSIEAFLACGDPDSAKNIVEEMMDEYMVPLEFYRLVESAIKVGYKDRIFDMYQRQGGNYDDHCFSELMNHKLPKRQKELLFEDRFLNRGLELIQLIDCARGYKMDAWAVSYLDHLDTASLGPDAARIFEGVGKKNNHQGLLNKAMGLHIRDGRQDCAARIAKDRGWIKESKVLAATILAESIVSDPPSALPSQFRFAHEFDLPEKDELYANAIKICGSSGDFEECGRMADLAHDAERIKLYKLILDPTKEFKDD